MPQTHIRALRKSLPKFEHLNRLLNHRCGTGIPMARCHELLEIEKLQPATTNRIAQNFKLDKYTLSRPDQLYEKMFRMLPLNSKDPILKHFKELPAAMESCYESALRGDGCCG